LTTSASERKEGEKKTLEQGHYVPHSRRCKGERKKGKGGRRKRGDKTLPCRTPRFSFNSGGKRGKKKGGRKEGKGKSFNIDAHYYEALTVEMAKEKGKKKKEGEKKDFATIGLGDPYKLWLMPCRKRKGGGGGRGGKEGACSSFRRDSRRPDSKGF